MVITFGEANMNLVKNWQPNIDKFHTKLSSWKAKSLSFGGILSLIKLVSGNLPTYFLSIFKAPRGVFGSLVKIRRKFVSGSHEDKQKIHWVAWEKVVAAKDKRGLGVGSITTLKCLD